MQTTYPTTTHPGDKLKILLICAGVLYVFFSRFPASSSSTVSTKVDEPTPAKSEPAKSKASSKANPVVTNAVKNKNVKAFLDVIAYAEGTSGADGYRTMFTHAKFTDFTRHPRQVQCSIYKGRKLCSDAAGRYQFLSTTWESVVAASKGTIKDFSPASQDLAAIDLLKRIGAYNFVAQGRFEEAVIKSSPTWASLPNKKGNSTYGQPVKGMETLKGVYLRAGGKFHPQ